MHLRFIAIATLLVQAAIAIPGAESTHRHGHGRKGHGRKGHTHTHTETDTSVYKVPLGLRVPLTATPAKLPSSKPTVLPGFIAPIQHANGRGADNAADASDNSFVPGFIPPMQRAKSPRSDEPEFTEEAVARAFIPPVQKSRKPNRQHVTLDLPGASKVPEFIRPVQRDHLGEEHDYDERDYEERDYEENDDEEHGHEEHALGHLPAGLPVSAVDPELDDPEESTVPEFIPPKMPSVPKRQITDEEHAIVDDEFDYADPKELGSEFYENDIPEEDVADADDSEDDSDPDQPNESSAPLKSRGVPKRNILYFVNWGIYGAQFHPQQIPANDITHVLYSFMDIAEDGTVKSGDTWADVDKHYEGDSWNDSGNNVYGCVKQLYLLKKKNRNMKVLMSIGGWTWSPKFVTPASTAAGRRNFAATAVKLVGDWGFDGIDIDWEYPANAQEAENYVLLLAEVRAALDRFSTVNKLNYRFMLTVATSAGPAHYNIMKLKAMDKYLDAWHLMAYDYAGGWDSTTGHQANVYMSKVNPKATKFSTDKAINDYIAAGVAPQKILMGMALYGRSFANTNGPGKPYQGLGGGTRENGIYMLKDLPRPGARAYTDKTLMTTITYDRKTRELVTMDNADSGRLKAAYINKRGLGGAFYWEASGDKTGSRSTVNAVRRSLGALEMSQNLLYYPTSVYDNLRAGMP
ncbi:hypothetical protein FZEAL_4711 [Fusarium zealandicum]|uniref:chitinase n=1 Tax=Fusarium zealandicum TaxID=1053134 RepID=A0A8H4ULR3_9HYPO|nr:hypothetical protein FZEAL_4711 [Fusarium zealandicum]